MKPQQLASKLTVWSKRRISYEEALEHAEGYFNHTLGEGLIKEFFKTVCTQPPPPAVNLGTCALIGCENLTKNKYCNDCIAISPGSAAANIFKILGDFLCTRLQS